MRRTSQSSAGPTPRSSRIGRRRSPQIARNRSETVARDVGALRVAGGIEPLDEQRQFLERVVVDVGRDARPFRLGGGDDQVALELAPGSRAGPAAGP